MRSTQANQARRVTATHSKLKGSGGKVGAGQGLVENQIG